MNKKNINYPIISRKEVERHNSNNNVWIIIDNYILDITIFCYYHPGGSKILQKHFGQDATKAYNEQESHKKMYTQKEYLSKFIIGRIDRDDIIVDFKINENFQGISSINIFMFYRKDFINRYKKDKQYINQQMSFFRFSKDKENIQMCAQIIFEKTIRIESGNFIIFVFHEYLFLLFDPSQIKNETIDEDENKNKKYMKDLHKRFMNNIRNIETCIENPETEYDIVYYKVCHDIYFLHDNIKRNFKYICFIKYIMEY